MAVFNVTETLVRIIFEDEIIQKRMACKCIRCCEDILALTLNALPSRYVSTDQGETYVKAQYLDSQRQSDIIRELAISISRVNTKPRHGLLDA